MPICRNCKIHFPVKITIDGKQRNLNRRKFCLSCSPFGGHDTRADKSLPRIRKGSKTNRVCPQCNKERFYSTRNKICPVCRGLEKRNRKKFFAIEYKGGKCSICQYDRCIDALSFHHLDPSEKEFNLSSNWHLSRDKLLKELQKCILVCMNCHAELHAAMPQNT